MRFLTPNPDRPFDIAHLAPDHTFLGDVLQVPTTMDLLPEFPTLIEAGTFNLEKLVFTPTHRAGHMIVFRFDSSYPDWVRKAQGL